MPSSAMPTPSSSRLSLAHLCDQRPSHTPMETSATDQATSSSTSLDDRGPYHASYGSRPPSASGYRQNSSRDGVSSSPSDSRALSVSEEEESVRIAVKALDDMRSRTMGPPPAGSVRSSSSAASFSYSHTASTPALSASSSLTSPSMASVASRNLFPDDDAASSAFVSRVSGLPIVNTALRAYNTGKASSRVVKYGAEMMESSVKSISRPVIDRLPVNQLDEFACRQLDRFGRYGRSGSRDRNMSIERGRQDDPNSLRRSSDDERSMSRSTTLTEGESSGGDPPDDANAQQQQLVSHSRWHNILYEAGGISAAVSEESMRRLKYCLHWLSYATGHIDAQILILRNFINSLSSEEREALAAANDAQREDRPISASHMQILTQVKRDVVGTIRQVVDVVSKYAGGALPEPARGRVREFILHLPQRWANTTHRQSHTPAPMHVAGAGRRRRGDTSSAASTAPSSPIMTTGGSLPLPVSTSVAGASSRGVMRPTAGTATAAAQRILTLATESLDMMRSVTGIFRESLDRAETWVERLRMVGIQRGTDLERDQGADPDGLSSDNADGSSTAPPTSFPPSPRSYASDFGAAPPSLDALTINSTYATPISSTSSLHKLAELNGWDYPPIPPPAKRPSSMRDIEGGEGEAAYGISFVPKGRRGKRILVEEVQDDRPPALDRGTVSAIRGTVQPEGPPSSNPAMDVDDCDSK